MTRIKSELVYNDDTLILIKPKFSHCTFGNGQRESTGFLAIIFEECNFFFNFK